MTDDNIDITLLTRIAKNAAKKATSSVAGIRQDIEQEMLLHVLSRRDLFDRYIAKDSDMPLRERENKLFVSLVRYGTKIAHQQMNARNEELGPIIIDSNAEEHGLNNDGRGDVDWIPRMKYQHTYAPMTEEQVLGLLPFIIMDDDRIPAAYLERVAIVRNAVYSCTKPQQEVLLRMAQGMTYAEISDELGLSINNIRKRWTRAHLADRCDRPIHLRGDR